MRDSGASMEQIKQREATKKQPGPLPKKVERVRERIEDDYENDGFESYSQSLKATELAKQQKLQEQ